MVTAAVCRSTELGLQVCLIPFYRFFSRWLLNLSFLLYAQPYYITALLNVLKFKDIFKPKLGIEKTAEKSRNRENKGIRRGRQQSGNRCQPVCHSGRVQIIISLMQIPKPLVCDFIHFCISRGGSQWPELYDEMCRVAGCRLFNGMGYGDLNRLGLSFALDDIEETLQMVDYVVAQMPSPGLPSRQ